jgi:hypothetical protein
LIGLDVRQEWSWLVVIDIMDWEHIRVKHVESTVNSGQYGFLAAAPIGLPVPAVIPALCARGFRRLLEDRKDDLIKDIRGETAHGSPCKFPEGMPDLMKHLLADHIDAEYWQQCWSNCVASDAKKSPEAQSQTKKKKKSAILFLFEWKVFSQ